MIITESLLESEYNKLLSSRFREADFSASLNYDSNHRYDLFISHSFSNRKLVYALVSLFRTAGYSVYVDWIEDSQMKRTDVTSATAAMIRNRLSSCLGLAYIATQQASDSKWCPWELGLGDGMLHQKVCILPVLKANLGFKGQEYLGLYDYITYERTTLGKVIFYVTDKENSYKRTELREWLNGNNCTAPRYFNKTMIYG